MKTTSYNSQTALRTRADHFATDANRDFRKARKFNETFRYFESKLETVRDFLLNSPYRSFTALYFLLLFVDTIYSGPITRTVMQDGLRLGGPVWFIVGCALYFILIMVLTTGAANGFAKLLDHKLRELQVQLEKVSKPGVPDSVIETEVQDDDKRDFKVGIAWLLALVIVCVSLSLFRIYIINGHNLAFNKPNDWFTLIIPLVISLSMVFFGIYKSIVFKMREWKKAKDNADKLEKGHDGESNRLTRLVVELEDKAKDVNENSKQSKDVKECIERYLNKAQVDETYYELDGEKRVLTITLKSGGAPLKGQQISALTADGNQLFASTDSSGMALIEWVSRLNYLRLVMIGNYKLPGDKFESGATIDLDLTTIRSRGALSNFSSDWKPGSSPVDAH